MVWPPVTGAGPGALTAAEVASQPDIWREAVRTNLRQARALLVAPGERVLFIGCGTSAFVARALARLREDGGAGESDWAFASELPRMSGPNRRDYDRVVALTRSGTTTEVLEALTGLPPAVRRVAVCGVAAMPVEDLVDDTLLLDLADEASVVQTRFPTTTLVLARAALGEDVTDLSDAAAAVLQAPGSVDAAGVRQFVFLARGWAVGVADEAALKVREGLRTWSEAYPAMDYRHGPIAVAGPESLVWAFGPPPAGLLDQVRGTGARVVHTDADPLVDLVAVHRMVLELAAAAGLDPDHPHGLQRSVLLEPGP